MHVEVDVHDVSGLQTPLDKLYPPKQVKQSPFPSQVPQGKLQTAVQTLFMS